MFKDFSKEEFIKTFVLAAGMVTLIYLILVGVMVLF